MSWLWEGSAANGKDAPEKEPQEPEGQLPECCLAEVFRVYKCFWLFFCPDQPLKHQIHPVQSFYKPIWWFCCSFLGCDVIKGVLNLRETLGILESSSMFKNFPDSSKAIKSLKMSSNDQMPSNF